MNIEIKNTIIKEMLHKFWCFNSKSCLADLYLQNNDAYLIKNSEIEHIVTKEYVIDLLINSKKFQEFLFEKVTRSFTMSGYNLYWNNSDINLIIKSVIIVDAAYENIKNKLLEILKQKRKERKKRETKQNRNRILREAKTLGYKLVKK
jgi:hypothetical protein